MLGYRDRGIWLQVFLITFGVRFFFFLNHKAIFPSYFIPFLCNWKERYLLNNGKSRFWNGNAGSSIWFVKCLALWLFRQLLSLDGNTFFLTKEKPLCFCRRGPGRGGGSGDSSLPVVSEWRGERANELMSAKCFEDEKAFSCVQHRRY